MKLSKTVWLIVAIVIFAIVLGVLFSIYSGQAAELKELESGLNATQTESKELEKELDDAGKTLTQAKSKLDESQAKFPESVKSIEYGEDLFEIADDSNVDLTSLSPRTPTSKKVGAVTYSVSLFTIVVKGNIDNILDFIEALRIGSEKDFQEPWSADLKVVNIGESQATITLDIYSYKG
jgi:type II secretory pathway pseudopilin PulG